MFLSMNVPRGTKHGSMTRNKGEARAVRLGQSLGIVLVNRRKQNKHR